MSKILLVEDVYDKSEKIKKCIKGAFADLEIAECSSYHSALKEIFENHQEYSLILLDMSMSTYDQNLEVYQKQWLEKEFWKECILGRFQQR